MLYNQFWEEGYRVFPLWGATNGECDCGNPECPAVLKHPRTSAWQHTPDWSEDQMEALAESGQFDTGYGVLMSGLLVIDVDERNGGAESYAKLLERVPEVSGAGLIVRSGSGGQSKHLYFKLSQSIALSQHHNDFEGLDFKASGYVVGPGSLHRSGNTYDVLTGSIDEIDESPQALIELLRKPDRHRASVNNQAVDVTEEEIADMLSAVSPDCDHETWVRCGMAVHHATEGAAFAVWNDWSEKSDKYPGQQVLVKRWHSFGKAANPVTLGTLTHYAEQAGWQAPVTFTSNVHFDLPEEDDTRELDTSSVDLLRPPGFVGRLAAWINQRNRHPRQSLAVAGALATVSSIAGMRYVDPLDGITPNLFLFGVAGSATGKESVLKSHQELLKAAGVSAAVHGGLKSEQEIYRNLVRHQAALYVLDELGETLAKVMNARARGGSAPYLEGIIGALLSLYSKANSHALITGDLKEEVTKALRAELQSIHKQLDNNPTPEGEERAERLGRQIASIDQGLENPYLCIFGLTTPEVFDKLMDGDMAANGFMGRSLIFRELEDNPKSKKRGEFKRGPVPDDIAATLQNLYAPGYSEVPDRVEQMGNKVEIPTRPDAEEMLDHVEREFWQMAERAKERSNLTPIPRRGYEQVAKLSMVLAIPEGLRTTEHVRWAYAFVMRDVEDKMKLAQSNDVEDKEGALVGRVLALVTKDHGETIGRIRNKCRGYRKEDIDTCVERLIEAGHLRKEEHKPERGRPSIKYFGK